MNSDYLLILIAGVSGFALGAGWFGFLYVKLKSKTAAYQRQLEKTSIAGSSNSSKVDVLEAKIRVLEKALNEALNKNSN